MKGSKRGDMAVFGLALLAGVAPLWASVRLPFVDLPQHLHLISVLHRLNDASTLFPEYFARRPALTPYLGYYYAVSGLNWLMPLELANRVFLTLTVAGFPLSIAALLRVQRRPVWPALLTLPFAYGDSLAWGFLNYVSALPLAVLACACAVGSVEDPARRRAFAVGMGVFEVAVLLFHVQVFAFLGLALPTMLLLSRAPDGSFARARLPAVLAAVPGAVMFLLWVGLRVGAPTEVAKGEPWKAWGPMLSPENLSFKTFEQNLGDFRGLLANFLPDGSDVTAVNGAFAVAALAACVGLVTLARGGDRVGSTRLARVSRLALVFTTAVAPFLTLGLVLPVTLHQPPPPVPLWAPLLTWALCAGVAFALFRATEPAPVTVRAFVARVAEEFPHVRMWALTAIAAGLLFGLPFDIRGYMYYLNSRYVHLVALLLVAAVPVLSTRAVRVFGVLALAVAVATALPLWRGFARFGDEARALDQIANAATDKPRVMGLIYATGSAAMTHPVYLHAAADLARERGGVTNFSFALTPHSPLMYRGEPPPTFPSEWRPDQMNYETQGRAYDHFLIRGAHPAQVLGPQLASELTIAAQAGDFWLVRRR